ncbi:MAG: MBOAT family protein [Bacilli bacterium]|nr:MBOAT family protein [Bacilli bacterium]
MNFTSLPFFVFLPVVLLLHYLLPHRYRYLLLLVASYFFYAYLNPWLLALIVSTTLLTYLCALGMEKYPKKRVLFLIISIIFTLGLLFVFKYLDFTLSLFVHAGLSISFYPLNLILPVGISFYTFQTLAYVIDVYKGKTKAEHHILYYALFISFFPQLVAGPIEKKDNLLPQLRAERNMDLDKFGEGLRYFVIGFVKKVIIADFLAVYVNQVYADLSLFSGFEILLSTFSFGIVIYCDFSGYCDIALGIAKWLGVDLSKNFDRPYLSSSLKEFWNRWHITLNDFFTEYIYIPLGGSKKGRVRKYLNILIVFFISGLWHGASLHFILWGLAHGLLLIIEDLLYAPISKIKLEDGAKRVIGIVVTYILVNLAWGLFRAQSLNDIAIIYSKIFASFIPAFDLSFFTPEAIIIAILGIALLIYLPYLPKIKRGEKQNYAYISMYALLILIVGLGYFNNMTSGGESSFIYFQF